MRTFIAIEITDNIREAIAAAQARLKNSRAKISWTKPANIHLTLKFLGEIPEEQLASVQVALADLVLRFPPLTLHIKGAGGFPNTYAPRILWIGCEEPTGALTSLYSAIDAAMKKPGFPAEERAFTAHLTLGRIKLPKPDPALTSVLESLKTKSFGTARVSEAALFQSQLRPDGAVYSKLSSHRFCETKKTA